MLPDYKKTRKFSLASFFIIERRIAPLLTDNLFSLTGDVDVTFDKVFHLSACKVIVAYRTILVTRFFDDIVVNSCHIWREIVRNGQLCGQVRTSRVCASTTIVP